MRVPLSSHPPFSREFMSSGARAYGFDLSSATLDRFESYYSLLSDWNSRMNLVSSGELSRFVEYHLLDSLKINSCFPLPSTGTFMDFGSGAGIPGIPLSLVCPDLGCVLVESIAKKCRFLSSIIESLGLSRATVLNTRMEDIAPSHDGGYDFVVTRATVTLSRFIILASRFLRSGGSLVSVKGETIDDELIELEKKIDHTLFHIDVRHPVPFERVRSGAVVVITKR